MLEYLYRGRRISGELVLIGQGGDAEIRIPNKGPYEDARLAVIREVGGHPCLIRLDADASIEVDGVRVNAFLPLRDGAVPGRLLHPPCDRDTRQRARPPA